MIVAMGSAVETIIETVDWLVARGEKVGVVAVRLFLPFCVKSFLAALPPTVEVDRRPRPHEGARLPRRAALPERRRRPGRGRPAPGRPRAASAAGATASAPRSSRPAWPGPCSTAWRSPPGRPLHGGHPRRRDRHLAALRRRLRPRGAGRPPLRVRRARRGRHGRGEQELDQDHRRADRQLRAGLLRLRLEEVGLDDGVPPALRPEARSARPTSSGRRNSSPAASSASSGRTDILGYAAPGRHRAPELAVFGRPRPGPSFRGTGRRR